MVRVQINPSEETGEITKTMWGATIANAEAIMQEIANKGKFTKSYWFFW